MSEWASFYALSTGAGSPYCLHYTPEEGAWLLVGSHPAAVPATHLATPATQRTHIVAPGSRAWEWRGLRIEHVRDKAKLSRALRAKAASK